MNLWLDVPNPPINSIDGYGKIDNLNIGNLMEFVNELNNFLEKYKGE